uniref:AT-hook motif nuclear-localized protein n=1 Tax=Davidia involucrata TaxID=16924 RepID=A0A5B7BXG4_DAVIN
MEAREGMSSGVTVIGAEAPSNYHVAARTENPTQVAGAPAMGPSPVSAGLAGIMGKKKRGRPRKYGPDGAIAKALSPMPISSSVPPAIGDFSAEKPGRGRPIGYENKKRHKVGWENLGESVACSAGANFTPHMITVNAGEDVTMKIISFSQQGPRAICIISAIGSISNVTLRQPDSSGGTLTYEGRFDILSLSGSFTPTDDGGSRFSRTGGMSIALASPDGRVVGGSLGGLLIAASPVQVVVGSFLPSSHHENKPKKMKTESKVAATASVSAATFHTNNLEKEGFNAQEQQNSASQKPNFAPSSTLTDNWVTMQTMQDSRKSTTDINISLQGE